MSNRADFVLSSNTVFTGLDNEPKPASIAISGNQILAIGDDQDVAPFIDSDTKTYQFNNQLIMAGFHDFHIHLMLSCMYEDGVILDSAASEEEAAEMVREFAASRPEDPWILGYRWYHVHWKNKKLPHRYTLDRLIPDRPVFLFNSECHGAWVNSKALEMLHINRDTPDPPFGEIHRDANGEPTGFLYEAAMGLAKEVLEIPKSRRNKLFESFLSKAASYGITSVSDFFPLPDIDLGDLELYRQFEMNGKLTTRINFLTALNGNLDEPRRLRNTYKSDKLRFSGLKQFLDGVPITHTAYLVDPYSDNPNTRGYTLIPSDVAKQWVTEADQAGFRVRLHACGDGAVRLGLDCVEAAFKENGVRDARHTIEHVEVIHPDDIDRFKKLGIIASMQPEHMAVGESFIDNPYHSRLGKERDHLTWPIKTLLDNGAQVAFSTDYPIVQFNPMAEIYRAVTRLHDDGRPEGGWNPQERISMAEALRAYTCCPAYGVFSEEKLGTLERGKLADIVVLDRNIFELSSPEELWDTKVKLTIMDGEVVYEDKKLAHLTS
ncbi:amidohydrolase [Pseudalkalibacillus decolorationis]|uniref:amidohydrolase n=1 Tax=Pseudalkalibacillus decolorationis TaxID=163879 RepID=UPI002147E976|nr:amidohydrolase [Pseudalkalibacillus decolorationis]